MSNPNPGPYIKELGGGGKAGVLRYMRIVQMCQELARSSCVLVVRRPLLIATTISRKGV